MLRKELFQDIHDGNFPPHRSAAGLKVFYVN